MRIDPYELEHALDEVEDMRCPAGARESLRIVIGAARAHLTRLKSAARARPCGDAERQGTQCEEAARQRRRRGHEGAEKRRQRARETRRAGLDA
jgi:hypothetical protein